jgi:hypothetical protein
VRQGHAHLRESFTELSEDLHRPRDLVWVHVPHGIACGLGDAAAVIGLERIPDEEGEEGTRAGPRWDRRAARAGEAEVLVEIQMLDQDGILDERHAGHDTDDGRDGLERTEKAMSHLGFSFRAAGAGARGLDDDYVILESDIRPDS